MSSAALQTAPHQSATITSLSPASSPATRQYNSQQPQPRDPYYNQQTSNASPPTTTRRSGRKTSGNGISASSPQQSTQYQSSAGAGSNSTSGTTRGASQAPPNTAIPSGYPSTSSTEYQRGIPPVAPPRTSSTQRSTAPSATGSIPDRTRRAATGDERVAGSNRVDGSDYEHNNGARQSNGTDRDRIRDDPAAASASAARAKRRQQSAQEALAPQTSSSSREPRQGASGSSRPPITSNNFVANGSRESEAVISRVVVSKPEVDIAREQERLAEAQPSSTEHTPLTGLGVVGDDGVDDGGRTGQRSRHDHSNSGKKEKNTRFGEYYLGNTLGEGEFGKVKMGWKQEGGVQVAIKLIRRDSVGTNPTRLAKIYREIAILREISHPNIVRLHEMVETERHIGIILEYASGGELFDYILNHRYLKDNAARRLFAQLVSGVGYLHKKGIVHRDLKLENLLLDRNRNIIITDFGFANTFTPEDELGEEIEYNLSSRDYVKRMELDKIGSNGHRRGDLMQTSCGSPCYAAPELVVSDSLYTGRKVDVWSCGVILYAMLAGYLPFDDDPANPEGDNINLLYKYIVSTPLTFPEYVTPHARDLLRRILVPDPRKRADLFEVARHSWLSEYSHVVGFITSSTTTSLDIANTTVGAGESSDAPLLARSASVREPTKISKPSPATVGDLARKHGNVDQEAEESQSKPQKDNKRRTVQVEYVAPKSQTVRGEDTPAAAVSSSRSRARSDSQGPVEVTSQPREQVNRKALATDKALPREPGQAQYPSSGQGRTASSSRQQNMAPPSRPGREPPRSVSDNTFVNPLIGSSVARPATGGSMTSTASGKGSMGLQSRGSYGLPVAPTVAGTTAHGRMAQPKNNRGYSISSPLADDTDASETGQQNTSQVPSKFSRLSGFQDGTGVPEPSKTHKRSNTVGGIFTRTASFFGGKTDKSYEKPEKPKKSYPPVSMSTAVGNGARPSMDSSRRSFSFGLGRKRSGSIAGSGDGSTTEKASRRFSLIPGGFNLKAIGIGKDSREYGSTQDLDQQDYDERMDNREYNEALVSQSQQGRRTSTDQGNAGYSRGGPDSPSVQPERRTTSSRGGPPLTHQRYTSSGNPIYDEMSRQVPAKQYRQDVNNVGPGQSDGNLSYRNQSPTFQNTNADSYYQNQSLPQLQQQQTRYPAGFNDEENAANARRVITSGNSKPGRGVLQKNNRKFEDAYEQQGQDFHGRASGGGGGNAGSSGAARKVMDFFRRRGKDRND